MQTVQIFQISLQTVQIFHILLQNVHNCLNFILQTMQIFTFYCTWSRFWTLYRKLGSFFFKFYCILCSFYTFHCKQCTFFSHFIANCSDCSHFIVKYADFVSVIRLCFDVCIIIEKCTKTTFIAPASNTEYCRFLYTFKEMEESINRVFETINTYTKLRGSRLNAGNLSITSDNIGQGYWEIQCFKPHWCFILLRYIIVILKCIVYCRWFESWNLTLA